MSIPRFENHRRPRMAMAQNASERVRVNCGPKRNQTERNGPIRNQTERNGPIRANSERFGPIRNKGKIHKSLACKQLRFLGREQRELIKIRLCLSYLTSTACRSALLTTGRFAMFFLFSVFAKSQVPKPKSLSSHIHLSKNIRAYQGRSVLTFPLTFASANVNANVNKPPAMRGDNVAKGR